MAYIIPLGVMWLGFFWVRSVESAQFRSSEGGRSNYVPSKFVRFSKVTLVLSTGLALIVIVADLIA